jgi:beta-glucosidase
LKLASRGATVVYHSGKDIDKAVNAAASADAVVFITGLTGKQEGESVASTDARINDACLHGPFTGTWFIRRAFGMLISGVQRLGLPLGGDRQELNLQPHDEKLGSALAAAVGDKLVMAISASGAIILPEAMRTNTAAILFSGYGGCRYGTALKDVLFGLAEPSGRLSFVMPETLGDLPEWDPPAEKVVYDRWRGYRLMRKNNTRPIWPFGFGLGYGQITLTAGSLSCPRSFVERFVSVSVEVQNSGTIPTSVVVQIYAGKDGPRNEDDYERVLIGFQKQLVRPGQVQNVHVMCRLDPIAKFNATLKKFEVTAGKYVIYGSQYERDPNSENMRVTCVNTLYI